MITHEKIGLQRSNPTFIFPPSSVSVERIAGFVLFQYYKQHALEDNNTFQKMICVNLVFRAYAALIISTKNDFFFKSII